MDVPFAKAKPWALLEPAAPIKLVKEVGGMVAENFELDLLEKKDFAGKLAVQWKEFRGATAKGIDYRAYLDFLFELRADPLIRNSFEMEFTVGKLLKKLEKFPGLEKLIKKLPKRVLAVIEAIKLKATAKLSGGGTQHARVDAPGMPLPKFGPTTPAQVEFDAVYNLDWVANVDLEKLFSDKDRSEVGAVQVGVGVGFELTLGLILDVEDKREIGAYLKGKILPVDFSFELGLPFGKKVYVSEQVYKGKEIKSRSETMSLEDLG